MKKIMVFALAAVCLFSFAAFAVDARSATETARALAPEGFVYLYTEKDGKFFEVHFLNEETMEELEISVPRDEGRPVKIETENDFALGSAANTLQEEKIHEALLCEYPDALIDSVFAVRDDGLFEIHVYFTLSDRFGLLKLNAETGEVIKRKLILNAPYDGWQTELNDDYFEDAIVYNNPDSSGKDYSDHIDTAPSFISVSQAKAAVTSRHPEARITEIELDFDDGKYVYEGEAYVNGREYDFKVDATTGSLIKWKLDD